jgi:hypothetical protein
MLPFMSSSPEITRDFQMADLLTLAQKYVDMRENVG